MSSTSEYQTIFIKIEPEDSSEGAGKFNVESHDSSYKIKEETNNNEDSEYMNPLEVIQEIDIKSLVDSGIVSTSPLRKSKFHMALTPAEKQRRYRERRRLAGLHEADKAKKREKMRIFRARLNPASKRERRKKDAERKRKERKTLLKASVNESGYKNVWTLGKAVAKVKSVLPNCPKKKYAVVAELARQIGLNINVQNQK